MSSQRLFRDIVKDKMILEKYGFPEGRIYYRKGNESYGDIVGQIMPNILIEDDCESMGGNKGISLTLVQAGKSKYIKSIVVKEFEGLDSLPSDLSDLKLYS